MYTLASPDEVKRRYKALPVPMPDDIESIEASVLTEFRNKTAEVAAALTEAARQNYASGNAFRASQPIGVHLDALQCTPRQFADAVGHHIAITTLLTPGFTAIVKLLPSGTSLQVAFGRDATTRRS